MTKNDEEEEDRTTRLRSNRTTTDRSLSLWFDFCFDLDDTRVTDLKTIDGVAVSMRLGVAPNILPASTNPYKSC